MAMTQLAGIPAVGTYDVYERGKFINLNNSILYTDGSINKSVIVDSSNDSVIYSYPIGFNTHSAGYNPREGKQYFASTLLYSIYNRDNILVNSNIQANTNGYGPGSGRLISDFVYDPNRGKMCLITTTGDFNTIGTDGQPEAYVNFEPNRALGILSEYAIYNPINKCIYTFISAANKVYKIHPDNTVTTISITNPIGITVDNDLGYIIVLTNTGNAKVYTETDVLNYTLTPPTAPDGATYNTRNKRLYLSSGNKIYEFNEYLLIDTFNVTFAPSITQNFGLAFNPNHDKIYIKTAGFIYVIGVDIGTGTLPDPIAVAECPLTNSQHTRLTFIAAYISDLAYKIVKDEYMGKLCTKDRCKLTCGVMLIERLKCPCNFTQTNIENLLQGLEDLYIGPYNDRELDILVDTTDNI